MKLLKVDTINQVREKLEEHFGDIVPQIEELPLFKAIDRYLAEPVSSPVDIPEFTRTVVDGYAVKASDTFGVNDSTPVFLDIIGEVEMGAAAALELKAGQAVYVPTGGMLPVGADAMVMVEYTEKLDEKTIAIYKSSAPGSGLMNKGDDFKEGQQLYEKGHKITLKDIGMLAAIGKSIVAVFAKPTVAIISTGDELVSIADDPMPGQVRDINSYTLGAMMEQIGAKLGYVALVRDTKGALEQAVAEALSKSDIVLLSGGSSAGNKDMTAEIIDAMGEPGVVTHGIAMKPGKPTVIGVIENKNCCHKSVKLAVGLPGHPMAAIIACKAIVEYFINKYYFQREEKEVTIPARIAENIHSGEGRETFTFVRLSKEEGGWLAQPIHAKSGSISQLRYADGYLRMSDLSEGVNAGMPVDIVISW